jgi:hypothetical protein
VATKRQRTEYLRLRLAAHQLARCPIRKKNQKKNSSALAAFFAIYPCFLVFFGDALPLLRANKTWPGTAVPVTNSFNLLLIFIA